ncbi:MAG: hypothetical protein AAB655_00940 [Patescibacteria group bacterium]
MAKKIGITSGGPGNCKSKAECESFCAISENQETCSNWAKEHGMDIPGGGPGGAGLSGPGGCKNQEECTAYCTANYEDEACKKMIQDFGEQGEFNGQSSVVGCEAFMPECPGWEEFCKTHQDYPRCSADNPQTPPSGGGSGDPSQIPQGYSSWEEFCKANIGDSRCTVYQSQTPTSGDGGAGFIGPGGCTNAEECQAYCTQNYQDPECQKFGPGSMIEPADQGFFAGLLSTFGPLFGIR